MERMLEERLALLFRRQTPRQTVSGWVSSRTHWSASFINSCAQVSSFASYCTFACPSRKCHGCPARYRDPTAARAYRRGTGGQRRGYSAQSAASSPDRTPCRARARRRGCCACPAQGLCGPVRLVAGEAAVVHQGQHGAEAATVGNRQKRSMRAISPSRSCSPDDKRQINAQGVITRLRRPAQLAIDGGGINESVSSCQISVQFTAVDGR